MRAITTVPIVAILAACAPTMKAPPTPPTPAQMAELWIDPGSRPRDLFAGPRAANADRPQSDARYEVISRDPSGFSITYHVRDARGKEWNVKIGPEAQTEVVASRIVWAVGYHEVPSYFVERWIAVEKAKGSVLGGARFRPHELGLRPLGIWSWQENPFVGTRPFNGLIVLMMILNSTDLKNDNNQLYEVLDRREEAARRWFVIKDLGATLGETGRVDPRRGDVASFERERFITGVRDGRVTFAYRGRHQEILDGIRVEDVRWMCERLREVSNRQLSDAFRAGNFTEDESRRYIARIRQKIDEGLQLQ